MQTAKAARTFSLGGTFHANPSKKLKKIQTFTWNIYSYIFVEFSCFGKR